MTNNFHPHWVHCGWCHPRRNLGQRISIPCTSLPRKGKPWDVVGNHHQRRHWTCHLKTSATNWILTPSATGASSDAHTQSMPRSSRPRAPSQKGLSSLSSGSDTLDSVDTESDMEKIYGAALSQQQILLPAT